MGFPEKEKPDNVYQGVDHFGKYHSTDEIYAAFDALSLTAYQPSLFLHATRKEAEKEANRLFNKFVKKGFYKEDEFDKFCVEYYLEEKHRND